MSPRSRFERTLRMNKWYLVGIAGLICLCIGACVQPLLDAVLNATVDPESRFGPQYAKPAYAPEAFVNWESPHVAPLALTPDGSKLLAVNTADNRLEVFDATGETPSLVASIPVGLDPVSVRARSNTEAWVANHVSDSISIVDLDAGVVVRTLYPGDEPTDVAFAGERAFVVCSQLNRVMVYALNDRNSQPREIEILGEDPRMAFASADGKTVFVSIFESGNDTTVIPAPVVSDPSGPYGGENPPPIYRDGTLVAIDPSLPPPPKLSLIVRRDPASGLWLDENGADWSGFVTWDFHDHDLAAIDANTLDVRYASGLMTLDMAIAPGPGGKPAIIGTEAINDIRHEPTVKAHFVESRLALIDPASLVPATVADLNAHLAGQIAAGVRTIPAAERARSLADPRGVVFSTDGTVGYVTGMGSNNLARIRADGSRIDEIDVGQGPTGLVLNEARQRLYVLNKFDATISTVDTATFRELGRTAFFDPTPDAIKAGRPFLYDARRTSGLGVTACGACHIDGRMDQIAWDLGNPGGQMKAFNQECEVLVGALATECADFHPMKGPMTTQTLQGIVGLEPLHWRGDREDLSAFNPAFVGLLGGERELSGEEMAAFQAFCETLRFPPNPNRNPDNSLKESVFGGNAARGQELFLNEPIDSPQAIADRNPNDPLAVVFKSLGGLFSCNRCHNLPNGTDRRVTSAASLGTEQGTKVPQLRNMFEKTGMRKDGTPGTRGFGFTHNGEFSSVDEFLHRPNFDFGAGAAGDQKRTDVIAFVMSLSTDTHAGVGFQATLDAENQTRADLQERIDLMLRVADAGDVGLVVKGRYGGEIRGFAYLGSGFFQSDRAGQSVAADVLRSPAGQDVLTWTVVSLGSQTRIGIDRDGDGTLDGDEQ
ncbi:MAG: hypothetical protein HZB38_08510 [Planctomycetes bacterium]|nr:hypothetical protein [Planctomycetota bacterium]